MRGIISKLGTSGLGSPVFGIAPRQFDCEPSQTIRWMPKSADACSTAALRERADVGRHQAGAVVGAEHVLLHDRVVLGQLLGHAGVVGGVEPVVIERVAHPLELLPDALRGLCQPVAVAHLRRR